MKTYIKAGHTYRTKTPYGGDLDLEKLIRDTMNKMGIPTVDPCCDAANAAQDYEAVRFNPATPGLERYDKDSKTWVAIIDQVTAP